MAVTAPQLYLVVQAGPATAERLAAVLARYQAASILIRPPQDGALTAANVQPIVAVAQDHGAAVLLAGDARLARTVKADGVHLDASETIEDDFAVAREIVGGRAIVGLDAGRSRHVAMTLAEAGADYIGFGTRIDAAERAELVEWWSEIFEVPVVAFSVAAADEAAGLAMADFLAIELPTGASLADDLARIEVVMAAAAAARKAERV